jgi:uncharacterized membrane protein
MKKFLKNINFLFALLLILSFILTFFVYQKVGQNPVVLKKNELGFNFLTLKNNLWNFYILGIIFLGVNLLILKKIKKENLRNVLNYANIVIIVIVFLISLQVYFLNL